MIVMNGKKELTSHNNLSEGKLHPMVAEAAKKRFFPKNNTSFALKGKIVSTV
jgi:hypothetical protein